MQNAAALLAEMLGTEYSGAAELSPNGKSLRLRLAANETGVTEPQTAVHETNGAGSDSLAGYTLQIGHPVVVVDLARDKRFDDAPLRNHGIKSAVAVPLKVSEPAFGSLIAGSGKDRHFDDGDVLFAETIAHLVAVTIAGKRAEQSLADQRRFADEVLRTVDALILVLDPQWRIVRINSACERVTGFSLADIKDRSIWDVFSVPEEAGTFQHFLEKLPESESPVAYESYLLTKHAERRLIAWSYSTVGGREGTPESIIATGVDITQRREAQEKAARAEQAAEEVRRAMAELTATGAGRSGETSSALSGGESPAPGHGLPGTFARSPAGIHADRRERPRRSYRRSQQVADIVDGKLPDQDEFREVQCRDISAGGFSFLGSKPPPSDMLVVALGVPPRITYLIAQVAHVTRIERHGQKKFLIGCSYIGRAVY